MEDNHIDTTPIKHSSAPETGAYNLLISSPHETSYYRGISEKEVLRRVGVHFIGVDYTNAYRTTATIKHKDETITITIYNDNKFR